MSKISQLRRRLLKVRWLAFLATTLLGVALVPIFCATKGLFLHISHPTLSLVCSILLVILLVLLACFLVFISKMSQMNRFIKEYHPDADLDALEEYSEGWKEASKPED